MDIVAFSEALGLTLFPVQRVVLKLIYGLPLDAATPFEVRFKVAGVIEFQHFTEAAYAEKLLAERRLNRTSGGRRVVLASGRRSGKNTLAMLVTAFEVYKQLDKPCTSDLYNEEFTLLGPTHEDARWALKGFTDLIHERRRDDGPLALLRDRKASDGKNHMSFQRAQDIEEHGPWVGSQRRARASLLVAARAANPKALRGRVCRFVGLSEYGEFPAASAREVYDAATRLLVGVGDEGRLLVTGTPQGVGRTPFRERYDRAFASEQELAISVPTWEMNPAVPFEVFAERHAQDPEGFAAEWGGEFLDEVRVRVPANRTAEVLAAVLRDILRAL